MRSSHKSYVIVGKTWTTDMHHRDFRSVALGPLTWNHQKGSVASSFAWPKPHGLPCLGCNVGGLLQAPSKTQLNHRTRSIAGDLGQPATWSHDHQGCYKFTLRLKRCPNAGGGHFKLTKWLLDIRWLFTVLIQWCCFVFHMQTIFSVHSI